MSEYISKTEMLIRLKCLAPKADDWNNCDEYNVAVSQYDYMCDYLKSIELADVVPVVHGHWCEDEFDVWCSNCSCAYPKDGTGIAGWRKISKYCDNCGAKMDESEDTDNA